MEQAVPLTSLLLRDSSLFSAYWPEYPIPPKAKIKMLRPLLLLVVILLVTVIQHASAWEPPMALCVLGFMAVTMVDIIIIHAQRKDLNALVSRIGFNS